MHNYQLRGTAMTSPTSTTPPKYPARLPTPAEADDMCGRAFLEAIRELNEEKQKGEAR
jgi:hypothetical protein